MIEVQSMSYPRDTKHFMAALLANDEEGWARLSGLMAILALPPTRGEDRVLRKRQIEVEIEAGVWAEIDAVALEADRLVFWYGVNGHHKEYAFRKSEGVPRWRIAEHVGPEVLA